MKRSPGSRIAVAEAFALYLLTGAVCTCVGSAIPSLMAHYNMSLADIAAFGSAFALGRVATVFFCGLITQKFGSKIALFIGLAAIGLNVLLIPITTNYIFALFLMALAGLGMGFQDSTCPVILAHEYKEGFSSSMSAGQAFFGAGCFVPPVLMSVILSLGLSWKVMYACLLALCIVMLAGLPFMTSEKGVKAKEVRLGKPEPVIYRHKYILFGTLFLATFTYCAITNVLHMYTSSYVMSFGIPEKISVSVLSIFSVGSMAGSLFFIPILRKVHTTTVLFVNSLIIVGLVAAVLQTTRQVWFFVLFALIGFFIGVVYSAFVALSTELMPARAALAASLIGFVAGGSDILTPLVTGRIVSHFSIRAAIQYDWAAALVTFAATAVLIIAYKSEKNKNGESIGRRLLCTFSQKKS